ncbi:MAG: response regulator [Pseudodesulfovibrio sp.]
MDTSPDIDDSSVVLIVEDSRAIVSGLQRSIGKHLGLKTEAVTTYDEAREYLNWNAKNVFLAILDLHLPGAPNGEIVDLFCSMAIPSIVFTSDFSQATRERMLSKEIVDYMVKDANSVSEITGYIGRLSRNRNIKVLVVEDSESFRCLVSSLLKKQMFQVVEAVDAEAALQVLDERDDIGLVITDYEMPGMNGVELVKAIRREYSKEQMPIVGISSISDNLLTAQFIKSGANDFLGKPFQIEEFFCRINHNVEMAESLIALKEANAVKNQFLGMAAHDLRSPISGINGLSEMLLEDLCGELNAEQREIIEFIHEANLHMNSMVTNLLDISVIEAGQLKLVKAESDLQELIEKRVRLHSIGAKKKDVTLIPSLQDVAPFFFDATRIGQVLDNLITNAMKFSPVGETIDISLEVVDGAARVCVHDNGEGIPPGEEKLLFQSFKKTSVQPTAGESSTGLGLPIVKKIVQAHEGTVWAEGEFGKGASFCFTLPFG